MCSFRFVVDRIRFRAMHYAVDNILMDCIFPSKVKLQKSLNVEQVSKPYHTLYIIPTLLYIKCAFTVMYTCSSVIRAGGDTILPKICVCTVLHIYLYIHDIMLYYKLCHICSVLM